MLFGSWNEIGRILLVGVLSYGFLILLLRMSGKRSLSKMNMFDFVITIALGSTFATIVVDSKLPLTDGLTALGILLLLQFSVSWLTVRSDLARKLVRSSPELLYKDGRFLQQTMQKTRIHKTEILQSVREKGIGSFDQVQAVVLETNGDISVIKKQDHDQPLTALSDVKGISS